MIANYGYKDGSGNWFISIDTDKCDGCGECVKACPTHIFEVTNDPNDPLREEPVAIVKEEYRKKIKYVCAPCKPVTNPPPLPCVEVCKNGAISHSW
jgi:ferredoxin